MSAKTILKPYRILAAADMSVDIVGPITAIQMTDNIAYQFIFTGAPVGTFNIQVSLDYEPGRSPNSEPANAGHWDNLTITPAMVAAGTDGSIFADLNQLGSAYIRATYTATSGTGSLDIWVTGKSVS